MKKICLLIFIAFFVFGVSAYTEGAVSVNAGETANVSLPNTLLEPDTEKVQELKEYFEPLQDNPQYFVDRKMRKKANFQDVKKLKSYKPNFGKKIWVKSWEYKDIKKRMKLFGEKNRKRKFRVTAIEVAEDVAKYLTRELENTNVDVELWAKRIEEFGRTYVNPDNAGKKKCRIVVADYQNGNYLQIEATKSFKNKKMCYFIGEEYDVIIKTLLKYRTRRQKAKGK
ncbi:hypothetical protein KAJ27_22935 [bacterium]|nr:hypothetical protein [bacterium]